MYAVVLIVVLYIIYNIRFKCSRQYKLIRQFPSFGLGDVPLFGSMWKFVGGEEQFMKATLYHANLASRLGGAARFNLFTFYYIVMTDAHDAAVALKTSLEKDYLYKFLRTFTGNGSAFVSGALARERKSVLMPSFHPRTLFSFVDVFWKESVHLANTLAPHAGAGPFSVERYLYRYNIRSVILAGLDAEESAECEAPEFLEAMTTWEGITKDRMTALWKHPDFLYKFSRQYHQGQKIVKTLHHHAQKILYQRLEEMKKHNQLDLKPDGSSYMNRIFDPIINSHLDEHEKREEILVVIIGTDLVGISMGFTLMLLGEYPEVQDRVYAELNEIFGGSDRPTTKEDLEKMTYLDMVCKESLRLFPPVPVIARKVLKEVALPSGRIMPAGVNLFAAILGIHRNPKYWGPDADSFDPDRFSPERVKESPPQAFIPFSFGPRSCVGYKYGQISMKMVLSTILRRYKIVGKPADGPVPNIRTKITIFLRANNDFEIQLVSRN